MPLSGRHALVEDVTEDGVVEVVALAGAAIRSPITAECREYTGIRAATVYIIVANSNAVTATRSATATIISPIAFFISDVMITVATSRRWLTIR